MKLGEVEGTINMPHKIRSGRTGWLRIPLPMHGTLLPFLVWKESTCGRITKPVHLNY